MECFLKAGSCEQKPWGKWLNDDWGSLFDEEIVTSCRGLLQFSLYQADTPSRQIKEDRENAAACGLTATWP